MALPPTNFDLALILSVISLTISIIVVVIHFFRLQILREQLNHSQEQSNRNSLIAREKLDLLNRQLQEQHEWNRREKSIQYSGLYHHRVKEARILLDQHFNIFTRKDAIPLNDLLRKMKEMPELRSEINYLLTYYENISIACKMGVADEDIIKIMLKGAFVSYELKLSNYIADRRKQTENKRLWANFSEYARKWRYEGEEDNPARQKTGINSK